MAANGETSYHLGTKAMQKIKERLLELNNSGERASHEDIEISSPSTSAQLTSTAFESHKEVLRLYAMSKIDIWTRWAPICEHQTPDVCARTHQRKYLRAYHNATPGTSIEGGAYVYAMSNIESGATKVHFRPIYTSSHDS